jgi:hypothetical protein
VAPLRETLAINRASGLPKRNSYMSLILRMLAWLSWALARPIVPSEWG